MMMILEISNLILAAACLVTGCIYGIKGQYERAMVFIGVTFLFIFNGHILIGLRPFISSLLDKLCV